MKKSGLTSATLQDLRRRARQSAGFEVEIEMEVAGEPEEFEDENQGSDDIASDLPGEPWNHDWKVTDPVVAEPEDNTERNTGHADARMVRAVIAGS